MLMVPHTNPAAPLFPRTSDSAVVEPIRAVNAAISMRPPPRFREDTSSCADVPLLIVLNDAASPGLSVSWLLVRSSFQLCFPFATIEPDWQAVGHRSLAGQD